MRHKSLFLVDVVSVHAAQVHRLFGPAGLGPGPAETFASLSESYRRAGGRRLIRVSPGSTRSDGLSNPYRGARHIPRPRARAGLTVADLVHLTGKHRNTVANHLKRLRERQMIFSVLGPDGSIRWWRYRFDPDVVADRDRIPHTSGLKRASHQRQRQGYYMAMVDGGTQKHPSRIRLEWIEGGRAFVDLVTGDIKLDHEEDL